MNDDLVLAKERLGREVEKIQADFSHLEGTISTTLIEREGYQDQLKSTQAVLYQTREEEVSWKFFSISSLTSH